MDQNKWRKRERESRIRESGKKSSNARLAIGDWVDVLLKELVDDKVLMVPDVWVENATHL